MCIRCHLEWRIFKIICTEYTSKITGFLLKKNWRCSRFTWKFRLCIRLRCSRRLFYILPWRIHFFVYTSAILKLVTYIWGGYSIMNGKWSENRREDRDSNLGTLEYKSVTLSNTPRRSLWCHASTECSNASEIINGIIHDSSELLWSNLIR